MSARSGTRGQLEMGERALRFGVVAEAKSDALRGCRLADRLFLKWIDWLKPEQLPALRSWVGLDQNPDRMFVDGYYLDIHDAKKLHQERRLPQRHGRFSGEVRAAIYAVELLNRTEPPIEGILYLRDGDTSGPSRLADAESARDQCNRGDNMAIGIPNQCMDAWVVAGFEPPPDEQEIVNRERKRLGFGPMDGSHRLSHKKSHPKSAKQVLATLSCNDAERISQCLEAPLETLDARGQNNGYCKFTESIKASLYKIISDASSETSSN